MAISNQRSEFSPMNIIIWKHYPCAGNRLYDFVKRSPKKNRRGRLRYLVGSNGGSGGSSRGRELPNGDGEVEDDSSCQGQQENHLARCQVRKVYTPVSVFECLFLRYTVKLNHLLLSRNHWLSSDPNCKHYTTRMGLFWTILVLLTPEVEAWGVLIRWIIRWVTSTSWRLLTMNVGWRANSVECINSQQLVSADNSVSVS